MSILLKSKQIYLENEIIDNGNILIEDDTITSINSIQDNANIIDLGNLSIIPGLIDTHTHGGDGHDTMESTYDAINDFSKFKIKFGTTSFIPTTVTTSIDNIKSATINVRKAIERGLDGAKAIGVYIEGPYISPKYKGAHSKDFIKEISIDEIDSIIDSGGGLVKSFIIAPEEANGIDAIKYLSSNGVIPCIGHTAANFEITRDAILNGARIATHLFNAMPPINHRDPGAVVAILNSNDIYSEIICDGIHVNFEVIKLVVKAKCFDKMILITDSMSASGLSDGNFKLGEMEITVEDGIARTHSGSLAGSTITLINALKNYHRLVGVPMIQAINAATINPARAYGLDNEIGSIKIGKRADIIAIDDDFNVKFVMLNGKVIDLGSI